VIPAGKSRTPQREDLNHEPLKNPVPATIISAIDFFSSDYPKFLDLIFIYFSSPRISTNPSESSQHCTHEPTPVICLGTEGEDLPIEIVIQIFIKMC
jgi:hypothetical protein